jgi:Fe2+ transport system protein FeoA
MANQPESKQPAATSLLDWVRSEVGKTALRKSRGREAVCLQVLGLKSVDSSNSQLIGRLGDLGFQVAEPIAILGHATLGEPLFVEIRETVLALRSEEASCVLVGDLTPEDR